jgi:hypothetical protein
MTTNIHFLIALKRKTIFPIKQKAPPPFGSGAFIEVPFRHLRLAAEKLPDGWGERGEG